MKNAVVKVVSVKDTTIAQNKVIFRCTPSVVLISPSWSNSQTKCLGLSAFIDKGSSGASGYSGLSHQSGTSCQSGDTCRSDDMLPSSAAMATCASNAWTPGPDNRVIQCYRAVQLLSKCPEIYEDTLCACYHAMDMTSHDTATRDTYLDRLKDEGFNNIRSIRQSIINKPIPDEIVDILVGTLIDSGVDPDIDELSMELRQGHINKTAQVETVFRQPVTVKRQ